LRIAFRLTDLADDDVGFADRHEVELEIEALAVTVGPGGADFGQSLVSGPVLRTA
jgi:hypothetical protein